MVTETTCEKEGKITYTATSKFDGKTYTDTKTVTTPATGHNWKAQSWNWNQQHVRMKEKFNTPQKLRIQINQVVLL